MPPKKSSEPKTEAKPKAAPTHGTYQDMIYDAIVALKDRNGSSRQSLKKYVKANNTVTTASDVHFDSLFKRALKAGVEKGRFEQPKGASGPTKLAKKTVAAVPKEKKAPAPKKEAAPKKEVKEPKEKKPVASKEKKAPAPKKAATKKVAPLNNEKKAAAPKKEKAAPKEKKAAIKKAAPAVVEKETVLTKTKSGRVAKTTAPAKKATLKKVAATKKATPKAKKAEAMA